MKIETISIKNFRCFDAGGAKIKIRKSVTAFVGNNGSGKTAIFAAFGKLFGTSAAQRSVRKSDFHVPVADAQIAYNASLSIDCVLGFPELDAAGEDDDDSVPEVFRHMSIGGEDDPLKARIQLRATWIDNGTPEGIVEEEIRWVPTLDEEYAWEDCKRVSSIERSFIQLIYVPASRNATDQVTNLLKGRLWRAAQWSDDFKNQVVAGTENLQGLFEDEDPAAYIAERLEKRWKQVHQGDTDAKPILRLLDSRLDDLVKRAEFAFFPDEAQQSRSLDNLSDGQRSLFHIALTAATLEIEQDALAEDPDDSVFDQERLRRTYLTILAIEEPENSLSPFFLSRIMELAREIGAMGGAQVLVSSHSASILSRIEPQEVRYARLNDATRSSDVRSLKLPPKADEARTYIRLAVKAYPELYFARFVILAEGESESVVLPHLADAMGFPMDKSFVPIVPLGGRFVRHFLKLLSGLGIPYATLLDLDTGRKGGGKGRVQYVVEELGAIGNDLSGNSFVQIGDIDLDAIDEIDDEELIEQENDHSWIKALREEDIYFSSPLDLDFAMAQLFKDAYCVARPGGNGPQGEIDKKKKATLKTDGNPDIYGNGWDQAFTWYPYLFIGSSKPEAHIAALAKIEDNALVDGAPEELTALLTHVQSKVFDAAD